ncbi:hypothetical protein KKC44_05715 [Patescibacteria group bacterium]|nr:hypothetical protein [Patescibacteria group bacterium]MBU2260071.1 hypothetical protein [Patescibacteria group bacterium]
MSTPKRILIGISLAIVSIALLRFLAGEDSWMCKNGEWVKHGVPSGPPPKEDCL